MTNEENDDVKNFWKQMQQEAHNTLVNNSAKNNYSTKGNGYSPPPIILFPPSQNKINPKKTYQGPWVLTKDLSGDWYLIPQSKISDWNANVIEHSGEIPKYAEYIIEPQELIISEYEIKE